MATLPPPDMMSLNRQEAERLSRNWWVLLVAGVISVIAGILILSIQWTLASLAIFIGAFLIIRGIAQTFSPPHIGRSRGWNVGAGILSVLVGISVVAFPAFAAFTLLALALFIGIWLVVWGSVSIVGSIANRNIVSYWWLSTLAGSFAVILGIIALFRPVLSLSLAIAVIAVWAIVVGITEIALSLEIRRLPKAIEQLEKAEKEIGRAA